MDLMFSSENSGARIRADGTRLRILADRKPIEAALRGEAWNDGKLGWFSLAGSLPSRELAKILCEAARVRGIADTMIVIGIGGRVPPKVAVYNGTANVESPSATFDPIGNGIDFFETLDWVVKEGYATEAELEAVEEENG